MNLGIKLLVAEDDPNLGTILKAYLTQKGYTVVWAKDGEEATTFFEEEDVDACILDVMMPVKDGFTVAKEIRKVDKKVPLIFLTAKNLEADKLKGFEIGADDYITKPFSMEELLDYVHQTLALDDDIQRLTAKECDLLRMFAINFGQLVDRNTCLQKIWKDDSYFAARSMDVYITKLRKYLKGDPGVEIVNVHGVGFKLTHKG